MISDQRVKVYRNLTNKCWSVLGPDGLLLLHAQSLVLKDCQFEVRESGRQRVLREKRKNVHAFVKGYLAPMSSRHDHVPGSVLPVTYNPYKSEHFQLKEKVSPILKECTMAIFHNDGTMSAAR